MAKARIGHIVEARILESLGVDYIDESEVLTPPTTASISTSATTPCLSCAEPATSGKPCAASPRALP